MTKEAALYSFFSSFSIPAYASSAVPDDASFPYLVYTTETDSFGHATDLTCDIFYWTDSEAVPNAKAKEISEAIGFGGKIIACDGGAIWLKRGSPFCQAQYDKQNNQIKQRFIQITAEYITQN